MRTSYRGFLDKDGPGDADFGAVWLMYRF